MKYKLEMYGWEVEATAQSLTDEKVELIKKLIKDKNYNELWEARGDLEDEGIIDDLYNPDLFHVSRGLDNGRIWFSVKDEDDIEVMTFDLGDMEDIYESLGDGADLLTYESYMAVPEEIEGVDNIFVMFDENKGGICEYDFESDSVPTPKDFCYQNGGIETPDGEWDFISNIFFKGTELEVSDHLDNRGKASTVEIYRKNGDIIK
jgi:hypothetical protein